jgi:hypothetical protein
MPSPIHRRAFAKFLVAGAAAGGLAAVGESSAPSEPEPPRAEEEPPQPPTEAELLLQLIQLKYPHHLDEQRLAEIRAQLEQQQSRGRTLGGFPLTNADGPAASFSAFRAED